MVIVNFIRDKEVGIFARAKRLGKGQQAPVQGLMCSKDESNEKEDIAAGFSEEESDKLE